MDPEDNGATVVSRSSPDAYARLLVTAAAMAEACLRLLRLTALRPYGTARGGYTAYAAGRFVGPA